MCSNLHLTITSWRSHLLLPSQTLPHSTDLADPPDLYQVGAKRTIASIESHSYTNDCSEWGANFFPILNSTYKSNLVLLRCLPSQSDLMKVLPVLPTRMSTKYGLSAALPHSITNPLPKSMLESRPPNDLEMVYSRILDLRERLRVEEIISEIRPDAERLYLDPPSYAASQLHLRDVRILLIRASQSLAYIERESALYQVNLDISALDNRRISQRSSDHPYHMISIYLKPETRAEFHNYDNFRDPSRIDAGIGEDWEALSADDLAENGTSNPSADEPLDSDDSGVLETRAKFIPSVDKLTARVNTRSTSDLHPPRTFSVLKQRAHKSRRLGWGRAGVVKVLG